MPEASRGFAGIQRAHRSAVAESFSLYVTADLVLVWLLSTPSRDGCSYFKFSSGSRPLTGGLFQPAGVRGFAAHWIALSEGDGKPTREAPLLFFCPCARLREGRRSGKDGSLRDEWNPIALGELDPPCALSGRFSTRTIFFRAGQNFFEQPLHPPVKVIGSG